MKDCRYKIIGERGGKCKILFSDRRMNEVSGRIYEIFDKMDIIDGIYVPTPLDHLNGKFDKKTKQLNNIKRKISDCRHKAIAANYSLFLITQEILNIPNESEISSYSEMISNKMCDEAELKNDVLIYETESFLFQVRTNVDIIIQLLKYVSDFEYLEDKNRKGDSEKFIIYNNITSELMRKNGDVKLADLFDEQVDDWLQKLNELRNEISHRSGLNGFTSLIFKTGKGEILKPQMPNGEQVDIYCSDVLDKLLNLYKIIFEDFVIPKL